MGHCTAVEQQKNAPLDLIQQPRNAHTMRSLCAVLVVSSLVAAISSGSTNSVTGQEAQGLIEALARATETSSEQLIIIAAAKVQEAAATQLAEVKNAEKVALEQEAEALKTEIESLGKQIDELSLWLDEGVFQNSMKSTVADAKADKEAKEALEVDLASKTAQANAALAAATQASQDAIAASEAATAAEQALNRCTIVLGSTPKIVRLATYIPSAAAARNVRSALSQNSRDVGFCVLDSAGTVPPAASAHLYCASSFVPPATPTGMDPINVRACKTSDSGVIVVKHFQSQSIAYRKDNGEELSLCVDYIKVSACAPITAKNMGSSGCTTSSPCSRAGEGDCDTDQDCAGAMKCKQRTATRMNLGNEDVPGVDTSGLGPSSANTDFCYDPDADEQQLHCVAKKVVYRCKTSCDAAASDCSPEQQYAAGMNV